MVGRDGMRTQALGRRFRRVVGLVAAALVACLTIAHARQNPPVAQGQAPQQEQKPQPLPTFKAEARLVRVDAFVSENGHSVEGLVPNDFEVLEDGVRQKIENLEYVSQGQEVAGRQPGEPERVGRLFVILIDTYHLPWIDRERIERRERSAPKYQPEPLRFPVVLPPPIPDDSRFREGLDEIINRVVGDEDRVAVLTPDMWAGSLNFTDKKSAVEEMATRPLKAYLTGQRPPELNHFEACFPEGPDIEDTMRVRYRLYRTFTALSELMGNLEMLRDERKGVFVVTRGWDPPPRITYYQDPRTGIIGEDDTVCHAERLALAERDFDFWWRSIIDDAKRANAALYTVYAHPLVTYGREGSDIDDDLRRYQRQWGDTTRPDPQHLLYGEFPAITHDRMLWHEALKKMAKDTNGRAILSMDDFEKGLQEISDTLSSYYLLGYYSTNTKRDGAFRKIAVNVRRKGVQVRARPGYRAVIPAEADAAVSAALPDLIPAPILAALAPLARLRSDAPFRVVARPEWDAAAHGWRLRVVGEIDGAQARGEGWRHGWRAELSAAGADGTSVGSASVQVAPGQSAFTTFFPAESVLPAGEYEVRARATGTGADATFDERTSSTVAAAAQAAGSIGVARLLRRPNAPRSQFQPTADQRFTRREVLRIDVPFAGSDQPALRLVDKQGKPLPLQIPVAVGEDNGQRVLTGAFALTNIAPGDYVFEITPPNGAPQQQIYLAFRVIP